MARKLPPLNFLRAFDAAARTGSFLLAGAELALTAGAVSYQVKALESRLGIDLFRRNARSIELTTAGRLLHEHVKEAFERLAEALELLEVEGESGENILRISALPAFAERWLVPRLKDFNEQHPKIEIMVSADPDLLDFVTGDFDVGLRYSTGDHPDLYVRKLMPDIIFPVCSPAYLQAHPMCSPHDVRALTLIHDAHWHEDWQIWLKKFDCGYSDRISGPTFSLYSMSLEAAASGLGLAMGHNVLVREEIASGRLVAPFKASIEVPQSYYFVRPNWAGEKKAIRAFEEWLLTQLS